MVIKLLHACGLSESVFAHRCVKLSTKYEPAQVNEYSYYLGVEALCGFQGVARALRSLWKSCGETCGPRTGGGPLLAAQT